MNSIQFPYIKSMKSMVIKPSSGCSACFLLLGTSFLTLLAQLQLHVGGLCGVCDAQLFLDPL